MAQRRDDEALFRSDLLEVLKKELKGELSARNLRIDQKVRVLYDITTTPKKGQFEPDLGFLEQDVVIFSELSVDPQLARHFRRTLDWTTIRMPHLVIEVKYRGINSHGLMTYSNIANKIKGIFTNAKYYLLLRYDDKSPETLLRHGTGFDRIIQLEKIKSTRKEKQYEPGAL